MCLCRAQRIWVMDRGMVSEENLEFLRARNAHYLVGTPKVQLRHFAQSLLEEKIGPGCVPRWLRSAHVLRSTQPPQEMV